MVLKVFNKCFGLSMDLITKGKLATVLKEIQALRCFELIALHQKFFLLLSILLSTPHRCSTTVCFETNPLTYFVKYNYIIRNIVRLSRIIINLYRVFKSVLTRDMTSIRKSRGQIIFLFLKVIVGR